MVEVLDFSKIRMNFINTQVVKKKNTLLDFKTLMVQFLKF